MPLFCSLLCSMSMPQAGESAAVSVAGHCPVLCNSKYPPAGKCAGNARNHGLEIARWCVIGGGVAIPAAARITRLCNHMCSSFLVPSHVDQDDDNRKQAEKRARQPDDEAAIMLVA